MTKYVEKIENHGKNEVWVFNIDVRKGVIIPKYLSSLKTVRIGDQAYDVNGKEIERNYMRPLFVDRKEFNALDVLYGLNSFS